jgi:hypothetical protein
VGAPLLSQISLMNNSILRKLRKLHIPNLMDVFTLLIYDNQKLIISPNYDHVTYLYSVFHVLSFRGIFPWAVFSWE